MSTDPRVDAAFDRLVEQWSSDHLGPDKDEGVGLLWKEGGYAELLGEVRGRAPRTMAALADRLVELDPEDTQLRDFLAAWEHTGPARREALEALDLELPRRSLADALDDLDPPMPVRFRRRIEGWIDLARGIEVRSGVPAAGPLPISDDVRRDLWRLRTALGRTEPPAIERAAVEAVQAEVGVSIPTDVLALLATLGAEPGLVLGLSEELEEFHAGTERPDWKRSASFDHVPFWAQGDWPRTYACFSVADPARLQLFDLKTGTFEPEPVGPSTILRRLWPGVDWDRPIAAADLATFVPTVVVPTSSGPVRHPKFGEGEIVEALGDRARIRFADGTVRTLLLRFIEAVDPGVG